MKQKVERNGVILQDTQTAKIQRIWQMLLVMRQSSMDTPAIHLKAGKKKNAVNYAELQKATITKFTMSIRLKT